MPLFNFLHGKTGAVSYMIVGLGNPGREYEHSRHNAGFDAIDFIADKCGAKIDRAKFSSLYAQTEIGGQKVLLIKPQTLMNLSGKAVSEAANFYKIKPENIIVICDDVSLAPGIMRIRRKGSDGGHKGLRSIELYIGSEEYPRIKLGVGDRPDRSSEMADWVLGKLPEGDRKALAARFCDVYESVALIIGGDFEKAMNLYN